MAKKQPPKSKKYLISQTEATGKRIAREAKQLGIPPTTLLNETIAEIWSK